MDQPDGHGASTSSQTDQQVVTIDERGVEYVFNKFIIVHDGNELL